MRYKYTIKGLDCANCALDLERAIKKLDGVKDASISFMSEKLIIECDENEKDDVMKRVEKLIKKEEPDVTIK